MTKLHCWRRTPSFAYLQQPCSAKDWRDFSSTPRYGPSSGPDSDPILQWKFLKNKHEKSTPRQAAASGEGEDGDEDDGPIAEGENAGEHVYRYLRSLTAWHDAVAYLMANTRTLLRATLIELTNHSNEPMVDIERIRASIVTDIDNATEDPTMHAKRDGARKWFERRRTSSLDNFTGRVHAEAGFMELAKASFNEGVFGTHDATLKAIFAPSTLSFGTRKKCCWTCWRLGQKLFNQQSGSQDGPTDVKRLELPGTHGIVYPWDPPAFGIPEGVLASLALELRSEVVRRAIEASENLDAQSRQSSPPSLRDNVVLMDLADDFRVSRLRSRKQLSLD
ncbi:hypothetical protein OF83DRAFT_169147 [Amylostereum chailletii]|nr:hypothetical protein OF83DRAFT_169147 [Amylostereum chailletii]